MSAKLEPGTIVVNQNDGSRGVIVFDDDRTYVSHVRAGTRMKSRVTSEWTHEKPPGWKLRPEERKYVALWADRALRSIECHRPAEYWRPVSEGEPLYDPGLVKAIEAYLESRDDNSKDVL